MALKLWGMLLSLPIVGAIVRRGILKATHHPSLRTKAMGLEFPNPIGLAAGFDKDARHIKALEACGFGFIEVGTVTAKGQPGNPSPRLFRLKEDRALINRMGFNNPGADAVAQYFDSDSASVPVGMNIGKSKVTPLEEAPEDYLYSLERLGPKADYLVVNVSSPNTPGLRDLQSVDALRPLLGTLQTRIAQMNKALPVLLKIAPDLHEDDIRAIGALVEELRLTGVIATNTTIQRSGLNTGTEAIANIGAGGLSGAPLKERSLEVLRLLRSTLGPETCIISVGGIENAQDVAERLDAGANLVQIYTGFVYGGPWLIRDICRGLVRART